MSERNLDELLKILEATAFIKSILPLQLRGHVNVLGLYVERREAGQQIRLQAGGSLHCYLDAWKENEGEWQVRKFDKDTWEHRFAQIVEPTYQIADFLNDRVASFGNLDSEGAIVLDHTIQHYKDKGIWLELPKVSEEAMDKLDKERASVKIKEEREKRRRRIVDDEKTIKKDPLNWQTWNSLPSLYLVEQRYKDMENAYKILLKIDIETARTCKDIYRGLGETYLAALSVSIRGKGIAIVGLVGGDPSYCGTKESRELSKKNMKLTPETLGYSIAELRELAQYNLNKAYELENKPGYGPSLKEVELSLQAVNTLSIEAFEELDKYQEREH